MIAFYYLFLHKSYYIYILAFFLLIE